MMFRVPSRAAPPVDLVVLDFDGTARGVREEGCEAVRPSLDALDAAGVPWTFSTGRPYASLAKAAAPLLGGREPLLALSNYNGGLVHSPAGRAPPTLHAFAPGTVPAVLRLADGLGMLAVIHTCARSDTGVAESSWVAGVADGVDHGRGPLPAYDPAREADVVAILLYGRDVPDSPGPDDVAPFQAALGSGATVTCSGYGSYEVSPPGVSKGAALADLAARFGTVPGRVMAMGDAANDLGMLVAAGVGVAVGNAAAEVKAAADAVTRGEGAEGVAEAVAWLLSVR